METTHHPMKIFAEIRESLRRIEEHLNVPNNIERNWLDPQQICQMLNISKRTLDSYRAQGIFPYSRIGGKVFYRLSDVEDYLNSHVVRKEGKS
ncbi:MAG: helix-turn-helix domain-containing protein [Pseudomonadota bacterium]